MWYYSIANQQQGPVDEGEMRQMIASGTLSASSLVWSDGMPDWQPLGETALSRFLIAGGAGTLQQAVSQPAATGGLVAADNPYHPPQAQAEVPAPDPAASMTWKRILWSFDGRIPRRTYWAATAIWIGIFFGTVFLGTLIGGLLEKEDWGMIPIGVVAIPYVWSSIAIQVKRWHDHGKSGAMVLVNLIPYVGGIWTFVVCGCMRGTIGHNRYGQDPT